MLCGVLDRAREGGKRRQEGGGKEGSKKGWMAGGEMEMETEKSGGSELGGWLRGRGAGVGRAGGG